MGEHADHSILQGVVAGDVHAFEILFDSLYAPLVTFATRILLRKDRAEEIVQDAFVLLWEQRTTIDIHDTLRGYMFRMVRNRSLNELARMRREEGLSGEYVSNESADESVIAADLHEKTTFAIAALPPRIRHVLELRAQGLTYMEISGVLSLPVKTVEHQGREGIKLLRARLA